MEELKKRGVAFAWNLGWVVASMTVGFLFDNQQLLGVTFHLSPTVMMIAGLVLTQVSKATRSRIN